MHIRRRITSGRSLWEGLTCRVRRFCREAPHTQGTRPASPHTLAAADTALGAPSGAGIPVKAEYRYH